jgi:hypothetical protein
MMADLFLKELHCVKKRDIIRKDEIKVYVGGDLHAGPIKIGKTGDDVTVGGGAVDFDTSITIELKELNGDKEESLGRHTARVEEQPLGLRTAHFHDLPGADYHPTYDVD